jgi:hypothetical protein
MFSALATMRVTLRLNVPGVLSPKMSLHVPGFALIAVSVMYTPAHLQSATGTDSVSLKLISNSANIIVEKFRIQARLAGRSRLSMIDAFVPRAVSALGIENTASQQSSTSNEQQVGHFM